MELEARGAGEVEKSSSDQLMEASRPETPFVDWLGVIRHDVPEKIMSVKKLAECLVRECGGGHEMT